MLQFLAAFAIISWLPFIISYTNWRNLYLSTVGYAGILAILSSSLEKYRSLTAHISAKRLLLWVVVFYALVGTLQNEIVSQAMYTEMEMPRIQRVLEAGNLTGGSEVYVLNLGNSYIDAVFLEDMVKATYGKDVTVRVLTSNIISNETPTVTQLSPYSFEVEYETPVMANNTLGFRGLSLAEGNNVSNEYFMVNVESMDGMGLKRMRFTMKKPLKDSVTLILDKKRKEYGKVPFT